MAWRYDNALGAEITMGLVRETLVVGPTRRNPRALLPYPRPRSVPIPFVSFKHNQARAYAQGSLAVEADTRRALSSFI